MPEVQIDDASFDVGWDAALTELADLLDSAPDEDVAVQTLKRIIAELMERCDGPRTIVGVAPDGRWIYAEGEGER